MAKPSEPPIEVSDDDFVAPMPAKRKFIESPRSKGKVPGASQKSPAPASRQAAKPKPTQNPLTTVSHPRPSIEVAQQEKKPYAAVQKSTSFTAPPVALQKKPLSPSTEAYLLTPPVVHSQDDDKLDVLWSDTHSPHTSRHVLEPITAASPPPRPQERSDKPIFVQPKPLEFEVDSTTQTCLTNILRALTDHSTDSSPNRNGPPSVSPTSLGPHPSPMSQRPLAIKSPAQASTSLSPKPLGVTPQSPSPPGNEAPQPKPSPPLKPTTAAAPKSSSPLQPSPPPSVAPPLASPLKQTALSTAPQRISPESVFASPSAQRHASPSSASRALGSSAPLPVAPPPLVVPAPHPSVPPPPSVAPPSVAAQSKPQPKLVAPPTPMAKTFVAQPSKPPPPPMKPATKTLAPPASLQKPPPPPSMQKTPLPFTAKPPTSLPVQVTRASSLPVPVTPKAAAAAPVRAATLPSLPLPSPTPKLFNPSQAAPPPSRLARPPSVAPPVPQPPPPPPPPPTALPELATDDLIDQLLLDPESQIDNPQPPAREEPDSAHHLPMAGLNAPLTTVRFPTGTPKNVSRLRILAVDTNMRVTARDENTGIIRFLTLKGEWVELKLAPDDFVNVIGEFDDCNHCQIGPQNNLLIHHPDSLVNITCITSTAPCLRRALLTERYRGYSLNKEAVYGTLVHGVFQSMLHRGQFTDAAFKEAIDREIASAVPALFAVGENEAIARERIASYIPTMQAWHNEFVPPIPPLAASRAMAEAASDAPPAANKAPSAQATAAGMKHTLSFGKENKQISISKILEIEECICSPVYGVKGKIDVSVEAKGRDGQRFVMPLELKGGKRNNNESAIHHRAQVYLYMLLMAERYRQPVEKGLLFYMSENMEGLKSDSNVLRSLLINRNKVARHLATNTLSPPIQNEFQCSRCPVQSLCMAIHKMRENGTVQSSGLAEQTWTRLTSHITEHHAKFMNDWGAIIDLEAGEYIREQPWLHSGADQEIKGRCLTDMVLHKEEMSGSAYLYHFRKRNQPADPPPGSTPPASLSSNSSLIDLFEATKGDYVSLSCEDGHYGVARGSIMDLCPTHIVIALDDQLRTLPRPLNDENPHPEQRLEGLFEVERVHDCLTPGSPDPQPHRYRSRTRLRELITPKPAWRIDREDLVATEGTMRNNIASLFTSSESPLRSLVVDLAEPKFSEQQCSEFLERLGDGCLGSMQLNEDQKASLSKVLAAQHYALILGMPGTGKSTTIVSIVKALVALGQSVLVTSYTNNAVDNVLVKLANAGVDFVRISSRRRDSPKELEKYTLSNLKYQSVEEYRNLVEGRLVVGATCLNSQHPVITKRRFNYCIVDEASQITLPICIGPLRFVDRFVLVGDHFQLPPVVKSTKARELGGDVSLFRRLAEAHPHALAALTKQYRMNSEIMILSNTLVYDGHLQCGTQSIAHQRLSLPNYRALCRLLPEIQPWLAAAVDPEVPVCFLNTDALPKRYEHAASNFAPNGQSALGGVSNKCEVKLVTKLVHSLTFAGLDPSKIGVITPYRAQLRFIGYTLGPRRIHVETDTVDRFQGRDKDCIIISFVRANDHREVGELLLQVNRLNVALSRAKCKLLMVGSRRTLTGHALYQRLFTILDEQRAVLNLPADTRVDADDLKAFEKH